MLRIGEILASQYTKPSSIFINNNNKPFTITEEDINCKRGNKCSQRGKKSDNKSLGKVDQIEINVSDIKYYVLSISSWHFKLPHCIIIPILLWRKSRLFRSIAWDYGFPCEFWNLHDVSYNKLAFSIIHSYLTFGHPKLIINVCCSSWCIGLHGWVQESKSINFQSSKTLRCWSGHWMEWRIGPDVSSLCQRNVPSGNGSRCDCIGMHGCVDCSSGKLTHFIAEGISIPNSAIVSAQSFSARSQSCRHGGTGIKYGKVPKHCRQIEFYISIYTKSELFWPSWHAISGTEWSE